MMNKSRVFHWLTQARNTVVAAAVLLVIVLVLAFVLAPGLLQLVRNAYSGVVTRITPGPIVVERLQALNRLETVRQVSRQVVEAEVENRYLPKLLSKDRLLMLVQTEAVAGIDLSSLSEDDVRVTGKSITITLPRPEIFSIHIDDEHTKVYSREKGWLVFTPNSDLERQARLKALADVKRAAGKEVLTTARENAEKNVRQLLGAMGFKEITIRWADQ